MISALVGDLIRCHRLPSVVSKIVPCRPTTQHTVFDGASPASKSDRTPVPCCCQTLRSVERKIVPESSSAQYTDWSGDETSTERAVDDETAGALALSTVARVAGAATAALAVIRDSETELGAPADRFDKPDRRPPVKASVVDPAGWCVRVEAKAFVGARARPRVCRDACARREGADGVARGCCSSLLILAVETRVLGVGAGVLAVVVRFDATGVDSAAKVESGATAVAFAGATGIALIRSASRGHIAATCRTVTKTTTAIAVNARHSRAAPHARMRLGPSACSGNLIASDGDVPGSDASSADFTALEK
jgi:hypothetical protein